MAKFIEGFADKLRVPEGARDVQVFDDGLPGFGIRKFASGKASYFCKFAVGTQQRRKTLGRVVRGNLRAMQLEASAILAKARLGTDVVAIARADAARNVATLGEVIPRYLAAREGELRPKTIIETARYLRRSWAPLHALPVDAISRQQIIGVIDDIERDSGAVSADRARAALSALLAWGIDRGYLGSNATVDIRPRAQNGARERVLTEAELVAVWNACNGADDFSRIVRLLVLTGCRRREIGDLGWSEIDLEKRYIHLPAKRTKNGRAHVIPLSDQAMCVLTAAPSREGRDLLFGNAAGGFADWARSKAKLDARSPKMASWLVHDLRRSFVTHVNERGFGAPHIIEACVNHIGGAKHGIAGRYNHASYLPEKRRTLELWGAHITALTTGKTSKVVPLRRAQSAGIDAAE